MRELAEQVRDRLLQDPQITQVDLYGARRYEVAIEIDQHVLRTYGLTLDQVAQRVRRFRSYIVPTHVGVNRRSPAGAGDA